MSRGMSRHHPEYIHQNDSHAPRQMLYRLIAGFKNARGLRIPASIHIKLALGGQDISLAPTSGNFDTLFSSTPRPMVYFSDDSEQYMSWKKLQDTQSKDGFTTEALALAAQYEALRVWDDYVKSNGTLKGKQAKDVVRTVAEAWVVLQVEYRYKLGIHVDYKVAQHEAREGALDALDDAIET